MLIFDNHLHHSAKDTEVVPFGNKPQFMLFEEWDDDSLNVIPVVDLIPITVLMVGAIIFLEINAATTEKPLHLIQNFLILFNKLYAEFRFYGNSSFPRTRQFWIADVNREASFTIYETYNVIRV